MNVISSPPVVKDTLPVRARRVVRNFVADVLAVLALAALFASLWLR